jgi:hypothetical protein
MSTPDQIQRDIENTRESLRTGVDRIQEKVAPGRVVGRRMDRVKTGARSVRERVMGAVPDTDQVKETASSMGDTVTSAPEAVRNRTQGSPLATGVVAFGVGMALSALIPASEQERQVAQRAQDRAVAPLQDTAKEVVGQLREPAQQAVGQVKDAARQAASDTTDDAKSAAQEVRQPLQR